MDVKNADLGKLIASRRKHIFVAVPTMDYRITLDVHGFLMRLSRAQFEEEGCPFVFTTRCINGLAPVEYARNLLVGEFLRSTADRLWFIDADMMPRDDATNLLHCDADIAAGLMFRWDADDPWSGRRSKITLCAYRKQSRGKYAPVGTCGDAKELETAQINGEAMDVDGVGTGSMIIRRRVLEDKRMWYPGVYRGYDDQHHNTHTEASPHFAPPVFRTDRKPNGQPLFGEDLDFCERAKGLGYSIKFDTSAGFGHYKECDLNHIYGFTLRTLKTVVGKVANESGEDDATSEPRQAEVG